MYALNENLRLPKSINDITELKTELDMATQYIEVKFKSDKVLYGLKHLIEPPVFNDFDYLFGEIKQVDL